MVVPDVVHAVTRQKIENAPAICGEQFAAQAALVADIHFQQIQQPDPQRIDMFGIKRAYRRINGTCHHLGPLHRTHAAEVLVRPESCMHHGESVSQSDAQ